MWLDVIGVARYAREEYFSLYIRANVISLLIMEQVPPWKIVYLYDISRERNWAGFPRKQEMHIKNFHVSKIEDLSAISTVKWN